MYAAVRRYEGVTDPAEDRRRVREEFVPLLKDMPGFVAYYEIDAGNGVLILTDIFGATPSNVSAVKKTTCRTPPTVMARGAE